MDVVVSGEKVLVAYQKLPIQFPLNVPQSRTISIYVTAYDRQRSAGTGLQKRQQTHTNETEHLVHRVLKAQLCFSMH